MSGTASAADHELARALHGHLARAGGFTLDRATHRPVRRGVSVGADPRATLHLPWHGWDHQRVARWVHRHAERCRADDLHLGGWLDPVQGEVCLDLVHVYPESARRDALLTGLRHQQHAVFDLSARSLVCLAGLTATSVDAFLVAGTLGANALGATG
jgi:hypothetical protein